MFLQSNYGVFKWLSVDKVIEKIKQYEQKQEEQIQVGDEVVFYNGEKCSAILITKDAYIVVNYLKNKQGV